METDLIYLDFIFWVMITSELGFFPFIKINEDYHLEKYAKNIDYLSY